MTNFDHDDDNEKQSKIQRNSKVFITRLIMFMVGLTIFSLGLGYVHRKDPPQLHIDIKNMMEANAAKQAEVVKMAKAATKKEFVQHVAVTKTKNTFETDSDLAAKVDELDAKVRARKATGVIMETDEEGLALTKELQSATIKLLEHRYGAGKVHPKFRVVVDLIYPRSIIKDPDSESNHGKFVIEMAPYDLIPCSVFYFLEIARTYKGGKFHRNANHVLQAAAQSEATQGHKSMPFQEYSADHPHAKYTTGYAGRPSGPGWYVSIQDNTRNHGPGSQQKKNPYEADSNFGRVVEGVENGVIAKIHSVPQMGWLSEENCVNILKLTILANSVAEPDVWTEWKMPKL